MTFASYATSTCITLQPKPLQTLFDIVQQDEMNMTQVCLFSLWFILDIHKLISS